MNIDELTSRAEDNDAEAQALLSLAYFLGDGVPRDFDAGRKWLVRAATDRAVTDAIINPKILSVDAEASLRVFFAYRSRVQPMDEKWGTLFLIESAKAGNTAAAFDLGIACSGPGYEVPDAYKGNKHAIHWFLKALEGGEEDAHRYLYRTYKDTNYPETVDHEQAFYHISQIAHKGSYNQTSAIGKMYADGLGTTQNLHEAFKWLFIAASTNYDSDATEEIRAVREKMSAAEYQAAHSDALSWIRENAVSSGSFNYKKGLVDPISGVALDIVFEEEPKRDYTPDRKTVKAKEKLISQWHEYCADNASTGFDTFYTLFYEDPRLSEQQLDDIFKYYELKDELKSRFKSICDWKFDRSRIPSSVKDISANARKDLLMRLKLCQENADDEVTELLEGIDVSLIDNATVRHIKDKRAFEKLQSEDTASGRLFDILYDDISGVIDKKSITGYLGLETALGGIFANDPLLVAHVLTPYATEAIDFEPYVNTLKAGAKYVLTFDELVVYIDPRRKLVT